MQVKTFMDSSLPMVFRLRRKALGLDQAKIAKQLGLSAMGLSYLERGTRELKLTTLEKWADILNLEVYIEVKPK